MIGPIARILGRYIASALISYGGFTPADAASIEPELAVIVGIVLGGLVEGAYGLAKRFRWTT